MPQGVVDACCLINVYAAGNLRDLLAASRLDWYIPAIVWSEVGKIRKPDPDDIGIVYALDRANRGRGDHARRFGLPIFPGRKNPFRWPPKCEHYPEYR